MYAKREPLKNEKSNAVANNAVQKKNRRHQVYEFEDNRSGVAVQRQLKTQATEQGNTNGLIQRVTVGELTKPVGKRLAAKHLYNTSFISEFKKPAKPESIGAEENRTANKFNARQVGRICGKRKLEGTQKGTNSIFNVTVAKLNAHIKADHDTDALPGKYTINTRAYKFASGYAGDKIMAFGGVQNGTGELHTNRKVDSVSTRYDHLEKTTPGTPLNPSALGVQKGGWLVKEDQFKAEDWGKLLAARDRGFADGEGEAKTAEAAAGDL